MNQSELRQLIEKSISESSNREELWRSILSKIKPVSVCEVGVWKGEFAEFLLSNVMSIEEYIFIDPWKNLPNWNKPANVSDIEFEKIREEAHSRTKNHSDKITEFRSTTKKASKQITDESLDFVYIDGDHTLRGITIDLSVMLSKIKVNGFIGGDDFTRNIWQHGSQYDPTEVLPYAIYFAEANDLIVYTLPFKQFLIVNQIGSFAVEDLANYASLTPRQIYSKPSLKRRSKFLSSFFPKWAKKLLRNIVD